MNLFHYEVAITDCFLDKFIFIFTKVAKLLCLRDNAWLEPGIILLRGCDIIDKRLFNKLIFAIDALLKESALNKAKHQME